MTQGLTGYRSTLQNYCNDNRLGSLVTWNMQGANWEDAPTSPWTFVERWLNNWDVCCLQECGAVPRSATLVRETNSVGVYQYNIGSTSRPVVLWIYFYPWDRGNRVNLAIVSRYEANDVRLFDNPLREGLRKLLGIRVQNFWVFTIHALSGGGNDAVRVVSQVQENIQIPWIIAGDYNQTPETLGGRLQNGGLSICPPNGNTHNARNFPSRMLDYAVWSRDNSIVGMVLGLEHTGGAAQSDHLPVLYNLLS